MTDKRFYHRLKKYYTCYAVGFILFTAALAALENIGFPRSWIGNVFLSVTVMTYAMIGILSRTSDVQEYYVAGRRVPAVFNGMATAADWVSAASFISLAGGLYLMGFDGLAYLMGWTGGYCLVALLIAPYLRKFGQYTIPDFLAARYGGNTIRILAVAATVIISFTYVVAQIYGVGLITSRYTGVDFSIGIFLGLASILVCSFLGGMRAVTWTQVAQYITILIAYMVPVMWLSAKHSELPVPQVAYGSVLTKLSERETQIARDIGEDHVSTLFRLRAEDYEAKLRALPESWAEGKVEAQQQVDYLKMSNAPLHEIRAASKSLTNYPASPEEARRIWTDARNFNLARAKPLVPHTEPFAADHEDAARIKRNNFIALVFCLMLGTAALPHILVRYYTTASVQETRMSAFWSLFFILLLYMTIPALAVLVKYEIYSSLVGSSYLRLPEWVSYWAGLDRANPLVSINDINLDGIVQLGEIAMDGDIVVLATPEIAGLPYVISGLIAAGGLAAALSTADGLLLTISNGLSHDIYYKTVAPGASTQKRVTISKLILLVVALIAAYAASLKPGNILSMVSTAFSLAASTLFPVLVLGIFWKRANRHGAVAGMLAGFGTCVYYMMQTIPALGGSPDAQWFHIAPISAGVFGVPAGVAAMIAVSLLTPPGYHGMELATHLRRP